MNELSSSEYSALHSREDSTHTFILRSIEESQRVIEDVEISLSLHHPGSKLQGPCIAVFNEDRKPYTPAFVNSTLQAELLLHDRDYQTIFESKVRHSRDLQLLDPRKSKSQQNPFCLNPNSTYCLICHLNFDNYFKHIDHPVHIKKINGSRGQQFIEEIVHQVNAEAWRKDKLMRMSHSKIKKRKKYVYSYKEMGLIFGKGVYNGGKRTGMKRSIFNKNLNC